MIRVQYFARYREALGRDDEQLSGDFATLDEYFEGYSVAGERVRALPIPADILMSADDPVIPLRDFEQVAGFPNLQLEVAAHGGHCGFIENAWLDGYAERWVTERLVSAV